MGTRGERRFVAGVVLATAAVVGWVLWVGLVVDVREVIGVEPGVLRAGRPDEPVLVALGGLQLLVTWLLPVAGVTALALLAAHLGRRRWLRRSRGVAALARLVPVVGVLGLVTAVSAVVWPGLGFALDAYTAAEQLDVAPPTGGIGPTRLATGVAGVVAVAAALVGGVVLGTASVLGRRHRRPATAPARGRT
ncbi:hypothetical protein [Aquipuribacter sp. SD81]|uniref:hypothetical protein n=1 Tax=Aquipuribacter sp. SD81 TaxID=3127703 RepID=UPI00301A6E3C